MDLLRSVTESFFYGMPIDVVIDAVLDINVAANGKDPDRILKDKLFESVKWSNRHFSESELLLLEPILESEWVNDKTLDFNRNDCRFLRKVPLLPNTFANKVLLRDKNEEPCVDFNHLLRWRQISLNLGEDIFTVPFIAREDFILGKNRRSSFSWPNIISHNNSRINDILDRELTDAHSHINAAMDVFEFNWLSLMNYPRLSFSNLKKIEFFKRNFRMEYDRVSGNFNRNLNNAHLSAIAAGIRLLLFVGKKNDSIDFEEFLNLIYDALNNPEDIAILKDNSYRAINMERTKALRTGKEESGFPLDYAIQIPSFEIDITSPYMIHYGERALLYNWFYDYYGNNQSAWDLAPLVVLYLIIKTKIRREFIQTNSLIGFSNFQTYQDSKNIFSPNFNDNKSNFYNEALYKYAVQSSLTEKYNHFIEARLTPASVAKYKSYNFTHSIFGNKQIVPDNSISQVSFVAHFIKKKDKPKNFVTRKTSFKDVQKDIRKNCIKLLQALKIKKGPELRGIDAASSELVCRPEVFAPYFRYLRYKGIKHFTFHAGEDFYDIVDGIRTVYETINFMDYTHGDRIGHALALGIDAESFYSQRHNDVIIPKQILLDNLVWIKVYAGKKNIQLSPLTLSFIEEKFEKLISELNYFTPNLNISTYWKSMTLRGDFQDEWKEIGLLPYEEIARSSLSKEFNVDEIEKKVRNLLEIYINDESCYCKGNETQMIKFPESFANEVKELQKAMLYDLERVGIVIETNPSSNIKIGRFDRYDQHPLMKFHSPQLDQKSHSLMVTINTDDKGVFATNLKNEYSLIAIALKKMKDSDGNPCFSETQIEEYLQRIARYGNIARFK